MITATGVELTRAELGLLLPWAAVLAHAATLIHTWNAHADGSAVRSGKLELTSVEIAGDIAVLHFQRWVLTPSGVEQRYERGHAVSRDLVERAAAPAVWQYPMERAVQQLIAQVPPRGFALPDEELELEP